MSTENRLFLQSVMFSRKPYRQQDSSGPLDSSSVLEFLNETGKHEDSIIGHLPWIRPLLGVHYLV